MKYPVNVPSKSNKQKNRDKKNFFDDVLKVTDENCRIRIRIWIRIHTEAWIRGSGLIPKLDPQHCCEVNFN